jgi:hypothetical protein
MSKEKFQIYDQYLAEFIEWETDDILADADMIINSLEYSDDVRDGDEFPVYKLVGTIVVSKPVVSGEFQPAWKVEDKEEDEDAPNDSSNYADFVMEDK